MLVAASVMGEGAFSPQHSPIFTFAFLFPVLKEGASSHYRSPIITFIFSTLWHIHFHFLNYVVFFDTSSAVYLLLNIAVKGIEYLTRPFIDVHCTHTSHSSWLIVHFHNSAVSLWLWLGLQRLSKEFSDIIWKRRRLIALGNRIMVICLIKKKTKYPKSQRFTIAMH